MIKKDVIERISERSMRSNKDVSAVLSALIEEIESCLVKGESLKLGSFGTFLIKERAARKGRNPATGEVIDLPLLKVPSFKPTKILKDKFK